MLAQESITIKKNINSKNCSMNYEFNQMTEIWKKMIKLLVA